MRRNTQQDFDTNTQKPAKADEDPLNEQTEYY